MIFICLDHLSHCKQLESHTLKLTLLEIREKSGETLFGEKVQEIHAKTVKVGEKSGKIKLLYKYLRKC